jgi:DNA (cytosine-5)-methyltransferase 1
MPTAAAIYGGIGGSLLGAQQAGFAPIYLIEPRDFASPLTVVENFGIPLVFGRFLKDFRTKDVDVIIGNPSCAQFSPLGMKRKDRGKLHELDPMEFEITKFTTEVAVRRPKYWLLENVPQATKHFEFLNKNGSAGLFFNGKVILTLEEHEVTKFDIECCDHWPYQKRHRIIWVGRRNDTPRLIDLWPSNAQEWKGCKEVLDDIPDISIPDYNHVIPNLTTKRIQRMDILKYGESYYGTQNNRRLDPDKPAYTITSHCTRHIHYKWPRPLTVRECARLQGFPDDFKFFGTETSQLDQVGKSLPVPVAKWLFERIGNELQERIA